MGSRDCWGICGNRGSAGACENLGYVKKKHIWLPWRHSSVSIVVCHVVYVLASSGGCGWPGAPSNELFHGLIMYILIFQSVTWF